MIPIEFRRVVVETRHDGGVSESEHLEYRVCIAVSNIGVSAGAWSDWLPLNAVTVRRDQHGHAL